MSKKINLTFEDDNFLTNKEIETHFKSLYGNNVQIEISPGSNTPNAHIYFAIDQLLTQTQCEIFFDQPELYAEKLQDLRAKIIKEFKFILNDVIMDNEERFSS